MTRTTNRNKSGRRSRQPKKTHPAIQTIFFILGVFLHPFFIGYSERFLSPTQEIFLLGASLAITLMMFLLSKSHFICSLLQTGGLLLNVALFVFNRVRNDGWKAILKNMDYEWWFRIILMWCGGVTITLLIRLFAHKKWNASHIRKTFSKGFLCSSIVFSILYIILLLDLFIFQRSAVVPEAVTLNLIPFKGAFATYWPHIRSGRFQGGVFVQFFGNLLIFAPLGFYLGLWWRKRPHKWILYLIPVVLAGVIEGCQYFLRIGQCDIDDLWMNVVGFLIGILIGKAMDILRKWVTKGKEKTIFKLPGS
ncbi:MAG: VanZ family protein [Clostridiales bacterium]|nr:VanZ family protein [Clostridiales bacterium]